MIVENKLVVVTGAAGGIGSALCRLLSQRGAKVVVADLDGAAAETVADSIGGLAVQCDVSDEASTTKLVQAAEQHFACPIDLFCSNAGFGTGEDGHAASASNETWQRNWDVHVMAHVYASRALLPAMIKRGDGYLLNVASAAGLLSQISDAAYTATKHAAVAFAESLAISHGDDGIKVSVVCPQYVNTNILGISKEQRAKPMEGVLTPEYCAEVIVDGIEKEQFLITPHPEVRDYMQNRANDPDRWLSGMRRLRRTLLDETGKVDFRKIFSS
ncbi:MAG: SDR family oxidoreductase [Gammaproteobacteria bacterium]|nr:SDR family oxidoreductase [Gammaproteobacteria bacterium]